MNTSLYFCNHHLFLFSKSFFFCLDVGFSLKFKCQFLYSLRLYIYKLQQRSTIHLYKFEFSLIRILCPWNIQTSIWKRSAQHPRLSWQYRDRQSIQQVCVSMQWVCIQCFRLGCVVSMPAIGKINAQISNLQLIIIWFL